MNLEELQNKYPIGFIYYTEIVTHRFYCTHDVIFQNLQKYYGKDNVRMTSPHHATCVNYVFHTVDGYIFDGEEWQPAERVSNHWEIIDEFKIKKEEKTL